MKIKSIEWWDDSVVGCTLTCSCGNEIETVIENDDVIECNLCKQSWKYHVHRTFTPIKQDEKKSKIKDGSDTKAFQDALSPPDLQQEWMDDDNIF